MPSAKVPRHTDIIIITLPKGGQHIWSSVLLTLLKGHKIQTTTEIFFYNFDATLSLYKVRNFA